jgi:hypothetical protein
MTITLVPNFEQMKFIGLNSTSYYADSVDDVDVSTRDYDATTDTYFVSSRIDRTKLDTILENVAVDSNTQRYIFDDAHEFVLTDDKDIKDIPSGSLKTGDTYHTNQTIGLRITGVNYDLGHLTAH